MSSNIAVFAIYSTPESLDSAVNYLTEMGFRQTDISVLLPENAGNKDLVHQRATKGPEGLATGGVVGAVVGGTLGWLTGVGTLAIPGLGLFVAAGPIMSALAGVGVGAATGGIVGALVGLGIPEFEAKRFSGRVKRGGILVSVHCDDSCWEDRAKRALKHTGGEDICSTAEAKADYAQTDRPVARQAPGDRAGT